MRKIFMIAMFAMAVVACGSETDAKDTMKDTVKQPVATEVVPAAATEVLPAAAPGPDSGGKVATEVIPDSVVK